MAKAIILSGGKGTRMKNAKIPKQYLEVNGKCIISYVIETCLRCDEIDSISIVADIDWHEKIISETLFLNDKGLKEKPIIFSRPGETRQLSVFNGLLDLKDKALENDIVVILDAARPNTSVELLIQVINAAKEHDGAMPVLPMKDTVYFKTEDNKLTNIDRSRLFAGQSPEAFKFGKYLLSNAALLPEKIKDINGSSQPMLLQHLDITMVPGEENNFKITTDEDLKRFEDIVINSKSY